MKLVTGKDMTILDILLLLCAVYSAITVILFIATSLSSLQGNIDDALQFPLNNPVAYLAIILLGIIGIANAIKKET